ncbi:MAG TPA: GTP-binding protein, partial [Spirochaetota bacterium]|nr:GTP-binding protein [Spirochaetota bacterium]
MEKINVALAGHTSVGKTLFLDTALYDIGAVDSIGKVDDGKSLSDFDEEEIKRKISIHSTVFSAEVGGKALNIIDTPGSSDFIGEVVSSLYGVESVVLLIDAVNGVEIETSKIFSRTKKMGIPVIIFINKMDKERADYKKTIGNIEENLGTTLVLLQIPIGQESGFKGVVDLIKMKAYISEGDGKKPKEQDVPGALLAEAQERRNSLIEAAAESTDELTEKYLEGETLTNEEIELGIKSRVADRQVVPVLFGSSLLNRGVKEALETIVEVAPQSDYAGNFKVFDASDSSKEIEVARSTESRFIGVVFKTLIDQFVGKITFLRILSGELGPDEIVYNSTKDQKERLSKLSRAFGKNQIPLGRKAEEGDIVVFTKLPYAETGHTLCSHD